MQDKDIDLSMLDNDIDLSMLDKDVDLSMLDENVDLSMLDEKPEDESLSGKEIATSLAIDVPLSVGSQALGAMTGIGYVPITFFGGMGANYLAQTEGEKV